MGLEPSRDDKEVNKRQCELYITNALQVKNSVSVTNPRFAAARQLKAATCLGAPGDEWMETYRSSLMAVPPKDALNTRRAGPARHRNFFPVLLVPVRTQGRPWIGQKHRGPNLSSTSVQKT